MFAVIYRFKLKDHQEKKYQEHWNIIVSYFKEKRGAIGSSLHKGNDGLWVAYSRWPDKKTRDLSWTEDNILDNTIPETVRQAFLTIHNIKNENQDLDQYEEICLEVVEDRL